MARIMISWKCAVSVLLMGIVTCALASNPLSTYEVLFGWKELDYEFPSTEVRNRYLQTKEFIPENNIVTGIKVHEEKVYLTVPRWRFGVPSTLNVIDLNATKTSDVDIAASPKLRPFPSWEMQEIGNCSALQFIQSMEIDEFGRMWIVDIGRENLKRQPAQKGVPCSAKLLLLDLATGEIVKKHEFPLDVVSASTNFLNDIVVGCERGDKSKCWAYISDAIDAKIIVYSLAEDRSWYVHHKTMWADPQATNIPILGQNYTFNTSIDGIALSPKDSNHDRVYYTPLSSFGLYSVPTSILKQAVNGEELQDGDVSIDNIRRSSQADGLAVDSQGLLFYGLLSNNSVVYLNTTSPGGFDKEVLLIQNDIDLQWPDTFAFDDKGYMYTVTNRMHRFQTNTADWTEVNYRVARVYVGTRSYMYSSRDQVSSPHGDLSPNESAQNPTNLDNDAPDQPVGVGMDEDIYKHELLDHQVNKGWGSDSHDDHHHSHQYSPSDQKAKTNSAPVANEQLPVVLFLSVLMYNPALVVGQ